MSESPKNQPDTLYRGITLPADAVDESIFHGDIKPGGEPVINEHGEAVVGDGNEYGVYMTDNRHMADYAYATPRHGDAVPGSPKFNWKGSPQSRVVTPRVGVLYEINTEGLDIKKPKITSNLKGHYNNGYGGEEWIAESVPAENHKVTKLVIGRDTLHPAVEFPLDDGHEKALEALLQEVAFRSGRLATAAALIDAMPDNKRHFQGMPERALKELQV